MPACVVSWNHLVLPGWRVGGSGLVWRWSGFALRRIGPDVTWDRCRIKGLFSRFSRVFTSRATVSVSARTRWNVVRGRSYVLLILAPVRTLPRSFCWGTKWFISSRWRAFLAFVLHRNGPGPAVAMSVMSRVKQNSTFEFPPSWPTRSISTNPGRASSHSAQVRIGIESFSSVPGLVWDRPCGSSFARSALSRRSIVAGAISSAAAPQCSHRSGVP